MTNLSKVVWSEGMYLGPHHFQTQARYFEESIHFAASALSFSPYGFMGHALDDEALRNGTVSVLHGRGIFPDGMVFHMPECDALPTPRNIAELFSPVEEGLSIYLGVGKYQDGGRNFQLPEGALPDARFIAEGHIVADETTGGDPKKIQMGRKNIQLLLESELTEKIVALPAARVLRDSSGHFVYDPSFIPPSLRISASARLMSIAERLIEILEEKSATLGGGSRGHAASRVGLTPGEIASFWFQHALNSTAGPLRHLFYSTRTHPEQLYLALARLAGSLCTFAVDADPRLVPQYEHDNLTACFASLDAFIRRHLELVIPTHCLTIPLAPAGDFCVGGSVNDTRCFGRSQWILSIRSTAGEANVISKTPHIVKVCSMEFVKRLVQRAMPGLALTHLPAPPAAISPRVEHEYFLISKSGPCWDHIVQTRAVGVYVPSELPDAELELSVLLEASNSS